MDTANKIEIRDDNRSYKLYNWVENRWAANADYFYQRPPLTFCTFWRAILVKLPLIYLGRLIRLLRLDRGSTWAIIGTLGAIAFLAFVGFVLYHMGEIYQHEYGTSHATGVGISIVATVSAIVIAVAMLASTINGVSTFVTLVFFRDRWECRTLRKNWRAHPFKETLYMLPGLPLSTVFMTAIFFFYGVMNGYMKLIHPHLNFKRGVGFLGLAWGYIRDLHDGVCRPIVVVSSDAETFE